MDLNEEIRIPASRDVVFAALNDLAVLRQAIPGCEELVAHSATEFTATVAAKVGPLKARFTGQVHLSDLVPPHSYTLSGEGKGGPAGHVRVISHVVLNEDGDTTVLVYDVRAEIGGKLAQLGGALIRKTAEKLAREFFHNFETLLSQSEGVAPETKA